MHKIGVLAIQGGFYKHCEVVKSLGHQTAEVRTAGDLLNIDALIIPGGESTTFVRLFNEFCFSDDIIKFANDHPIMGTCAGLIVLSKNADHLPFKPLGLIDISVSRNAYGRQKDSFVANVEISLNGEQHIFPGVFIRAPIINKIGSGVKVLAKHKDNIVMVEEGKVLAATFHPELTDNFEIHRYFIDNLI